MIVDIDAARERAHQAALQAVAAAERSDGSGAALTPIFSAHAAQVLSGMWELADELMFKYADGFVNEVMPDTTVKVSTQPYPDWWLKDVGYQNGPPPVPKPNVTMGGV